MNYNDFILNLSPWIFLVILYQSIPVSSVYVVNSIASKNNFVESRNYLSIDAILSCSAIYLTFGLVIPLYGFVAWYCLTKLEELSNFGAATELLQEFFEYCAKALAVFIFVVVIAYRVHPKVAMIVAYIFLADVQFNITMIAVKVRGFELHRRMHRSYFPAVFLRLCTHLKVGLDKQILIARVLWIFYTLLCFGVYAGISIIVLHTSMPELVAITVVGAIFLLDYGYVNSAYTYAKSHKIYYEDGGM